MNKIRQFWALLKFQLPIDPSTLIIPMVIGIPYLFQLIIPSIGNGYHPRLDDLLSTQSIEFIVLFGAMMLAPEAVRWGASAGVWSTGTEFLLTRAVDRPLVLRARSAVFYLLFLVLPLAAYCFALKSPDLQITEYNKLSHQQVLEQLPGSIPEASDRDGKSNTITIPNGKALIEAWRLWLFMSTAIGVQVFVYLVYPLKYRKLILWGAILVVIFTPLLTLGYRLHEVESTSSKEMVFFAFVSHQALFWVITISALLLGQLWCERRFSQMEQ
jgi:hypothetical protein